MSGGTSRQTSLIQQTFALLWKNILLQWRRPGHTVLEWVQHLALIFVLFSVILFIADGPANYYVPAEVLGRLDGLSNESFPVGYVPTTPAIQNIMQRVNRSNVLPGISVVEYENASDMEDAIYQDKAKAAAVNFKNEFMYDIRYNKDNVPTPNDYMADRGNCREADIPCRPMKYWYNRFISLQASIDSAIIERVTKQSFWDDMAAIVVVKMKAMSLTTVTVLHMGTLMCVMNACFVSLSYLMTLQITRERRKTRELMRTIGLKDLAFWLSWGFLYSISAAIIGTLMTAIVTTFVFVESSFGVIWLLFFLYGLATVCFNCMLSALFRKHHLAALLGFFITLFLSALGILPLMTAMPKSLEIFLSIFHPFSFAVGITQSMHMEMDLQGASFSEIGGDSFHVLSSAIYLSLDCVLYILLTLYFDKIIPDKHGVRHEPLFFLRASFWSKEKTMTPVPQGGESVKANLGDYVEKVPAELLGKDAIRISNVIKKYSGMDKNTEALRGLDLDIYEGQITALLGHSGAGKSTLLNILSGMCSATSGQAIIYDHPLSDLTQRQEIQRKIGFCPQFDVNFELLTVKENLGLYARIKGVHRSNVKSEVEKVLRDLEIENIQDLRADKLSGGQRRKLTLAIALLGNPEILLLDEPTAGLDPFSRHRVWSILKEHKAGHVTLFSTQFMDEADILADRKAVLSNGRLKCVGSSFFLKRKWGIGYHLRMQVTPSCNTEAITSLIKQHVSNAKFSTQNVEDLTFTLPFEDVDAFPALFSNLEEHVGRDIVSYGVSITTLDDVFLKLEGEAEIEKGDYGVFSPEKNEDEDRDQFSSEPEDSTLLMSDSGTPTITGLALWRQQVLAVAKIRYLKLVHDSKSFRSIILLLVLFVFPMVVTAILTHFFHSINTWELTPHLYFRRPGDRAHIYYSNLLLVNTTGLPIDHLVSGITAQDIAVDIVNGPYDENTTGYNGAIEITHDNQGYGYKIIGNPKAHNGLPVLVNIISNAIMRIYNSTERIRVWNDPIDFWNFRSYTSFFTGLLSMIFGAGLAPHFAMSSLQDLKIKARSQLRISGLFPSAYWCGQALVDVALSWLLLFLMVAILFVFSYPLQLSFVNALLVIVQILGYGMSMVFYVYLIAAVFGKRKIHHNRWSFFFILSSIIPIIYNAIYFFQPFPEELYIFLLILLPPSNLMAFFIFLIYAHESSESSESSDFIHTVLWAPMAVTFAHIIVFCGLLWFLEWWIGTRSLKQDPVFRFTKREHPFTLNPEQLDNADEEVLAEQQRVNTLKTKDQPEEKPTILVDSLRKEFKERSGLFGCFRNKTTKKRTAINNTSFCVKKGEVLGLLGPNGAGKTTSVLIMAGEMKPTAGQVLLGNAGDPRRTEDSGTLGYCPQNNPLWPNLTVKEHLEIYAAVKGMKKEDADHAIKRVSEALELKDHLNKASRKLSAGVSRKVCFAISMLGNPTIVLLDEPSTGLDPKGQQRLWRAIRAAFKNRERGAILTTHYMEEAEAVCDRVAIMVSGKLRCIGPIQHLKSKFGKGYLLEIKLKDAQQGDEIHQEVLRLFPKAARQDRFSSLLVYKIPMDNVQSLSQAFSQLENAKQVYNIEEYSFSQSTLEQVFLELAKEQEKEDFHLDSSFGWKKLRSEEI